jgi:mannosyltransferase OCH1-like enzyme
MKIIFVIFLVIVFLAFIGLGICMVKHNMVFRDRSNYSYRSPDDKSQKFPKIIHQTWKTKDLDPKRKEWQTSVREMYPDYTHLMWLDEDIERFARENFPGYMKTWDQLKPFIKKVDAVRYMWMYKLGGIYFDMDVKAMKRMDGLLTDKPGAAFIPVRHSPPNWRYDTDAASPAIVASYPGNPIWLEMLDYISQNIERSVLRCTGPIGLANVLRSVHKRKDKPSIVLLSEPKLGLGGFGPYLKKYSYHVNTNSWVGT